MKTLVVYASKHGCAEKTAGLLAEKLAGEVTLVNLEKGEAPDPVDYDAVVVGGSVYVGNVQKSVSSFLEQNKDALMEKRLGLYLCCSHLEQLDTQMKAAFPEPLYSHGVKEHLGFAYDFKKLNFFERMIIKKIAKVSASSETIYHENVERLAAALS